MFEFYCVPHQSLVFSDLNIKGCIVEPSSRSCGWSEDRGLVPPPKRSRILGGAMRCWSWASDDLSSQFSVTQQTSGLTKKGWTFLSRLFLVPASADFLSISNKWFSPAVVRSLSTSSRQLAGLCLCLFQLLAICSDQSLNCSDFYLKHLK